MCKGCIGQTIHVHMSLVEVLFTVAMSLVGFSIVAPLAGDIRLHV